MMEPLTLPCAGQVMQLSVQTEATSSLAAEQPEAAGGRGAMPQATQPKTAPREDRTGGRAGRP